MYEMNNVKRIKASTFANLVATTLYEKRMGPYFVSPIVVGLDLNDEKNGYSTTLSYYDSIGCHSKADDFACAGTATDFLTGTCETFYQRN